MNKSLSMLSKNSRQRLIKRLRQRNPPRIQLEIIFSQSEQGIIKKIIFFHLHNFCLHMLILASHEQQQLCSATEDMC